MFSTLDIPTLPAAACAGAYVAPVERESEAVVWPSHPHKCQLGHLSGQKVLLPPCLTFGNKLVSWHFCSNIEVSVHVVFLFWSDDPLEIVGGLGLCNVLCQHCRSVEKHCV